MRYRTISIAATASNGGDALSIARLVTAEKMDGMSTSAVITAASTSTDGFLMPPDPVTAREPMMTAKEYCRRLDTGLELIKARYPDDVAAINRVRNLLVGKSCLLDRLVYCGEKGPSQTPCPVHQGSWSGIHLGWPGQMWSNGEPVEVQPFLAQAVADGCRCSQHKCGCTTGWQPDEHCGCVDA